MKEWSEFEWIHSGLDKKVEQDENVGEGRAER